MRSKDFIRHMRLVLRIIAFAVWVNMVYNYISKSMEESNKPSTREVVSVEQELSFPTILVCNTMQSAPLNNRQICGDGPSPSTLLGDERKCIPVESIVFETPQGMSFCLKFEAPKAWKIHVRRDPIIVKTEIDLPDMLLTLPFGQRELILPAGLNVIVLNSEKWDEAVKNYQSNSTAQKKSGHKTMSPKSRGKEFGHYMDEMSRSSSVVLVGAGKFSNIIVRARKWKKLDGTETTRYSVDESSRPRLSSKSVLINVAYASEDIMVTEEYIQFDWYQVFGLSAAVAVFLDLGIRFYMFFVGRIIGGLCGSGEMVYGLDGKDYSGGQVGEDDVNKGLLSGDVNSHENDYRQNDHHDEGLSEIDLNDDDETF